MLTKNYKQKIIICWTPSRCCCCRCCFGVCCAKSLVKSACKSLHDKIEIIERKIWNESADKLVSNATENVNSKLKPSLPESRDANRS